MIGENELVVIGVEELTDILQNLAISPWLTMSEAANYLRCSVRKVEQLVARGKLQCYRLDPSLNRSPRLIHRKHLIVFLVTGRSVKAQRLSSAERALVEDLL